MPKIIINEPGQPERKFSIPLKRKIVTFGSLSSNDIQLFSAGVSSHHCKMEATGRGFEVIDLDSSYGTCQDGERKKRIKIKNDTLFEVGKAIIEIVFKAEERQSMQQAPDIVNEEHIEIKQNAIPQASDQPHFKPNIASVGKLSKNLPVAAKPLKDAPPLPVILSSDINPTKATSEKIEKKTTPSALNSSLSPAVSALPLPVTPQVKSGKKDPKKQASKDANHIEEGLLLDFDRLLEKAEIRTKFGGNPDWLDEPEWPICLLTNEQMRFIGQVKIEKEILAKSKAKMAYIFLKDRTPEKQEVHECVVILQPGDNSSVRTINKSRGPALYRYVNKTGYLNKLFREEYRQMPAIRPITEADMQNAELQLEPLNKILGSPEFVTSKNYPDKDTAWELLLQLNKDTIPFYLDIADGGIFYCFIDPEGTKARVIVQKRYD